MPVTRKSAQTHSEQQCFSLREILRPKPTNRSLLLPLSFLQPLPPNRPPDSFLSKVGLMEAPTRSCHPSSLFPLQLLSVKMPMKMPEASACLVCVFFFFFLSTNNISFNINIQFYENIEKSIIILVTVQQEHVSLFTESEMRFSIKKLF